MFRTALILLLIAVVAAILGFGNIAASAAAFARIVFWIAIVLAILSFIFKLGKR